MDLMEHAAAVWARRSLVLALALAAALGVLAWRSAAAETYVATVTVQARLPVSDASDPSVQVGYYADTVAGLATSRSVVEQALVLAGRDDEVLDEVAEGVVAEAGDEPGFVTVSASGATGTEAAALAAGLAQVLTDQVAADQAADLDAQRATIRLAIGGLARQRRALPATDVFALAALDRERETLIGGLRAVAQQAPWRLAVVEPASAPTEPDSPVPHRDALLAFLLALVLAAEGVVVARAWRRSLSARDPALDVAEAVGAPAVALRRSDGPTALATLLPSLGDARSVTVVQRGRGGQTHTAELLAELLAARGEDVVVVEAGVRGRRTPAEVVGRLRETIATSKHQRVLIAADVRRVDDLLGLAPALAGPTVLSVDTSTTRPQVRSDAAGLRGLGLDVVAATVHRGGRLTQSWRPS